MNSEFGGTNTAETGVGWSQAAFRTRGKSLLGAAAIAGLMAVTAIPGSAGEKAPAAQTPQAVDIAAGKLPSLGRHIRRAARLNFNVSLKFDDQKSAASPSRRPSLARFVRARGHGSEATTVDGYGPDRLVESVTFPSDGPMSSPRGTAMADVKAPVKPASLGLR